MMYDDPIGWSNRRCGFCDRELVLRDGRLPLMLFGKRPRIIKRRSIGRIFCDENCEEAWMSWRLNP